MNRLFVVKGCKMPGSSACWNWLAVASRAAQPRRTSHAVEHDAEMEWACLRDPPLFRKFGDSMDWSFQSGSLDFTTLRAHYASNALKPSDVVRAVYRRLDRFDHVWISRVPDAEAHSRAIELERNGRGLPLYGIPFAVKDNIDVAGMPTTAGCKEFSYVPATSAAVVTRLIQAGAILVGKTNMDQFATGLVGVRSPYGPVANPFDARWIAGGSSSGSAVAVSTGMVSFALGTDTAGSGRVPAGFTNIVGLKPTRGLLSCTGVVPACRTLDCVSILALTCGDARQVLKVAKAFDAADPFSRAEADRVEVVRFRPAAFRFGVPGEKDLEFFGDRESPALYARVIASLERMNGQRIEIDFTPFREAAKLLYDGPWVAERLAALKDFYAAHADALLPVTRKIVVGATRYSAVQAFEGTYRLQSLKRQAEAEWKRIDVLVVPTAGTIYTLEQVESEPISLNNNLGYYTNFVNLLDLCALAVPCALRRNGLPFGATLIAPAFSDGLLCSLGIDYQARLGMRLGATTNQLPP
jgi:allophanate hydrolase